MDLRDAFERREPVAGNWVSLADPAVAELAAEQGFDLVVVDLEHTPLSLETAGGMVRAVDAASGAAGGGGDGAGEHGDGDVGADGTDGPATVVRIPENDPAWAKRALDIGPDGLMVPMIETSEQARAFVEATRYPPEGVRGVGAGRDTRYGLDLTPSELDRRDPVRVLQIETERGVENAADIAATEGVDSLFVGPADLSRALGVFGEWEGERFREAVDDILAAGESAGVPVGTLATEESQARQWVEWGYDYVVAGFDMAALASGNRRAKEAYEAALNER